MIFREVNLWPARSIVCRLWKGGMSWMREGHRKRKLLTSQWPGNNDMERGPGVGIAPGTSPWEPLSYNFAPPPSSNHLQIISLNYVSVHGFPFASQSPHDLITSR